MPSKIYRPQWGLHCWAVRSPTKEPHTEGGGSTVVYTDRRIQFKSLLQLRCNPQTNRKCSSFSAGAEFWESAVNEKTTCKGGKFKFKKVIREKVPGECKKYFLRVAAIPRQIIWLTQPCGVQHMLFIICWRFLGTKWSLLTNRIISQSIQPEQKQ